MTWERFKKPWTLRNDFIRDQEGIAVASILARPHHEEQIAIKDFILRACNCHDELLEACKLALVIIRDMSGEAEDIVKEKLIRALAKAEPKGV